jgi:ATP-binding cassette subfamily B protein
VIDYIASAKKGGDVRPSLGLLVPVFRRHRLRLFFGFVALLGVDFLQLQIPGILKNGIDSLSLHTASNSSLLQLAALILLIASVVGVLRFTWRILIIGFSRLLERDLREQIFTHLLLMDRPFFGRWSTGGLMAHSGNDLSAIQLACGMGMVAGVDALVMGVAAIAFMLAINLKLTLIALLPMPVLAISTKILSGKMHKRFTVVQEQFGHMTEFVRNGLVSIRLIKGYCLEKLQGQEFSRLGKEYVQSNLKVAVLQGGLHPLAMLTGNAGMLLVLYFGGRQVIEGVITLGDFVAFVTYLTMLIWPMMAIGWVANLVQRGLSSLQRVAVLLQAQPIVTGGHHFVKIKANSSIIQCKQLTFTYPRAQRPALIGISLSLTNGIIGIAGRTGSGKSTLCRLIARLYPISDSMLFFAGHDVNTLEISSIREQISYVGQEVFLFADTIYNNICFGRPEASRQQVENAARAAAISEDILSFTDGYDALVGERGVKLSGGQRQRLALARALLSDRPVLIIDDGLSALDVETEQQVFAGIRKHYKNRLVLLVSHRINLLRATDRIIMFDEGRIVATGDHEQMYAASSLYKIMADKQQDKDA